MSKEPNLERMSQEDIDEIKIEAYMSKEQTPITAEEKKRVAKEMSNRDWKDKEQTPITAYDLKIMFVEDTGLTTYSNKPKYIEWLEQKVLNREQYAQAKVLEALERDLKDLSDCYKAHAEDNPRKEVCQVLHTLIMEKQEQIAQTKQK